MSKNGNDKKSLQLGEPIGTAAAKLRKSILFALVQNAGLDICFRCGRKIERASEFSIEHKIPWLDSADPVGMYFDLNNISFAHFSCNVGAARNIKRIDCPEGTSWCSGCKQFLSLDKFSRSRSRRLGVGSICRNCNKIKYPNR